MKRWEEAKCFPCPLCRAMVNRDGDLLTQSGMISHAIQIHRVEAEALYVLIEGKPQGCLGCGCKTKFISTRKGYNRYCKPCSVEANVLLAATTTRSRGRRTLAQPPPFIDVMKVWPPTNLYDPRYR